MAWVAERRDVLSTLFWFLSLAAYLWYARRPSAPRYLSVAALAALGLLSKPMVVTLPVLLLILDIWPGRLRSVAAPGGAARAGRLLLEKAPLAVLSAGAGFMTFLAQRSGPAVSSLVDYSWQARLENAPLAYLSYLSKTFWPTNLAVYYPLHVELLTVPDGHTLFGRKGWIRPVGHGAWNHKTDRKPTRKNRDLTGFKSLIFFQGNYPSERKILPVTYVRP